MNLEFTVPIFDFNYIGENESPKDMWNDKIDFNGNLKDYLIDSEHKIVLKKFDNSIDWDSLRIDVFSQLDIEYLHQAKWTFEFECKKEELDDYKQKLNLLLLAFRVTKYSDISIKYIICKNAFHFSSKCSDDWKYAIAEKNYKKDFDALNNLDLDEVIKGYIHLIELFKVTPRTTHAINFLFLAYTSYYWMEAFLLFMTSLESLVSPPTEDQITTKILKRTRKLINDPNVCSKKDINNLYQLRSE